MFEFYKSLSGRSFQTPEILPTTASETYAEGEGLVVTAGKLTKTAVTVKPMYVAAKAYVAPAAGMLDLPVYPVLSFHVYKTSFAADASANAEGTLVTLHTDGGQITATAAGGVATIIKKLGTGASGTEALIRFL